MAEAVTRLLVVGLEACLLVPGAVDEDEDVDRTARVVAVVDWSPVPVCLVLRPVVSHLRTDGNRVIPDINTAPELGPRDVPGQEE